MKKLLMIPGPSPVDRRIQDEMSEKLSHLVTQHSLLILRMYLHS